jgi:ribonuclease Y
MVIPLEIFLVVYAITGALVMALVFFFFWKIKLIRESERAAAELARKETRIFQDQQKAQVELELEKRQLEMEKKWNAREIVLEDREDALTQRAATLEARSQDLENLSQTLAVEQRRLASAQTEMEPLREKYLKAVSETSGLSPAQAREAVLEEARRQCAREVESLRAEILSKTETEIEAEARKTLLAVMQRLSNSPSIETTATLVPIPNEEMKGRIIGREGRNIRSFEAVTGTTLLVDETPDSVLISAFDPVRREVARQALTELIKDGRIHPASIESFVQEAEDQMSKNVIELGEDALRKLRLYQVHPEIVTILGKMHYRLSMNQNALEHSIEVARIASLLASEIGLDPTMAKRAGLFHDLGKAMEGELEGSHAQVAANLLKRHGEAPEVINAVASSHGEVPPTSEYAGLVMLADALSASRPGARSDSLQSYISRIKSLEDVAKDLPGVKEVYALQAGRELRVIVRPEEVDDSQARLLARRICTTIEDRLDYPSRIKVVVVRESRFLETAV